MANFLLLVRRLVQSERQARWGLAHPWQAAACFALNMALLIAVLSGLRHGFGTRTLGDAILAAGFGFLGAAVGLWWSRRQLRH